VPASWSRKDPSRPSSFPVTRSIPTKLAEPSFSHRLKEPSDALAFDVAAQRLGHMYLDEVRPLSRLLI